MKITLLSPYHGGSHRAWAAGYQQHSSHDVALLTMPDRYWKWRMHGGAVTLARQFMEQADTPDLLLATDMLDLTTFLSLTRRRTAAVPVALYCHENQLTYPLPVDGSTGPMRRQMGERDQHYAFINYASMMAADAIFFNSDFHRRSFLDALPVFLRHFPEYTELESIAVLEAKCAVLPVGLILGDTIAHQQEKLPPLILWNQRWEYDKNPEAFFDALFVMADEGVPFRLALAGQEYGKRPLIFTQALERLDAHIVHVGHAERGEYEALMAETAVVISTAHHEFFGISILEAIHAGAFPILPNRLSYPELIPSPQHVDCLYADRDGLLERLRWALTHDVERTAVVRQLQPAVAQYDWSNVAPQYDDAFSAVRQVD
jgi:glycosyltransferase involved in cell wall biosynthesis